MAKKGRPDDSINGKPPKYLDDFGHVSRGYLRSLLLKGFADSGRSPTITDVEVAVCFADLRGFTNYVHKLQMDGQDNRVQNFLSDYFEIYPMAVLHSVWSLEPDSLDVEPTAIDEELKKLIVPTSYKNLGDGMMIVWELQNASTTEAQLIAARHIISTIEKIQENFSFLNNDLTSYQIDCYSKHVKELRMGFGLARGHAWRLDFGLHSQPDYAGSIINLAARLQGLARPSGIVSQLEFSESKLMDYVEQKKGRIEEITAPKGFGDGKINVWMSNEVINDGEANALP